MPLGAFSPKLWCSAKYVMQERPKIEAERHEVALRNLVEHTNPEEIPILFRSARVPHVFDGWGFHVWGIITPSKRTLSPGIDHPLELSPAALGKGE